MFLFRCFFQSSILVVIIVVAFLIDVLIDHTIPSWDMQKLGIFPRELKGLWGIFFSPFLHKDWSHLKNNVLSLWPLLFVLNFFYRWIYWLVIMFSIVLSGMLTWFFGTGQSVHIGASGLVFALVNFLIVSGFLRRTMLLIVVSLVIGFNYQFLFWGGLLPVGDSETKNISYAAHWAGVIAGVVTAFALSFLNNHSHWLKKYPRDDQILTDSFLKK